MRPSLLLAITLTVLVCSQATQPAYDGLVYLVAGRTALQGHPLVWPGLDDFQAHQLAYHLEVDARLSLPFVSLPQALPVSAALATSGTWMGTQVLRAAGALSWLLVVHTAAKRATCSDSWMGTWVAGFLLLPLVSFTVQVGQVTPLLALAAVAVPAWLAGGLLALSAAFKAWPAALAIVLAYQRSWRALAAFLVVLSILTVVAGLMVPAGAWADVMKSISRFGATQVLVSNLAPRAVLSTAGFCDELAWTAQALVSGLLLGLAALRLRKGAPLSVAWVALTLAVPLVWLHYLLVPLAGWLTLVVPSSTTNVTGRLLTWAVALVPTALLWAPPELASPLGMLFGTILFARMVKSHSRGG